MNVRSLDDSMTHLTCAVTVTAAGDTLTPLIIFKGTPNGRVFKETQSFTAGNCVYACQKRAWMDERVCIEWVDKVIKPWAESAPAHVVPFLLLDSYKCHLMETVVKRIQDLGVEVDHIPGGCTGLVQPVDVGINKPLKNLIREKWEQWMMEVGIVEAKTKKPSRESLAGWVVESLEALGDGLIQFSWRCTNYSFFPTERDLLMHADGEEPEGLLVDLMEIDTTHDNNDRVDATAMDVATTDNTVEKATI